MITVDISEKFSKPTSPPKKEGAWVLYKDRSVHKQWPSDSWEYTTNYIEIANAEDIIFCNDPHEAMVEVRKRYPEEYGPFTNLYFQKWYNPPKRKGINDNYESRPAIIFGDLKLIKGVTIEEIAEYLKKMDKRVVVYNINDIILPSSYRYSNNYKEELIEIRKRIYDAGIAMNITNGTMEYAPKKATAQRKRMMKYYKSGKLGTRRLTFYEITNFSYKMRDVLYNVFHEYGLSSSWHIRQSWNSQVCSYSVGGIIRTYALLFDKVFGKGSYRNMDEWKNIKDRWCTLTNSKKVKLGTEFVEWIEKEFKKPRTKADLTKGRI